MKRLNVAPNAVLSIEEDDDESYGSFYHFRSGDRAYLNADMLQVLEACFGMPLLQHPKRKSPLQDNENVVQMLDQLKQHGFVTSAPGCSGRIKRVMTRPPLRVLFLETTKRCNLRCDFHCYLSRRRTFRGELDETEEIVLLKQADALGVMEVQLTGGEMFLLPWAEQLVSTAQELLLPISIFTNATILKKSMTDLLRRNPYGVTFYVSLDGPETFHDAFRGVQGAFRRTLRNIRKLIALGCDVRVNTTVCATNLNLMGEFSHFVQEELGLLQRLVAIEEVGNAASHPELLITPEQFAACVRRTSGENVEFLDSHDPLGGSDWAYPACGVGHSMMFIDSFGNVSLCPTLTQHQDPRFLAGNIRKAALQGIWETSPTFTAFRGMQCREVATCPANERCKGGCRSNAFLLTGEIDAPDPGMCGVFRENG